MTKKASSAQHAFLYLTAFITLGFVGFGVGNLCFEIINFVFPESTDYSSFTSFQSSLKFSIAAILVTAPIFFFLTKLINQHLKTNQLEYDSAIRKWLTYIALFIASALLIGDFIGTIFGFLDGELTVRFVLKALTILVIAGLIFGYYFTDIRSDKPQAKGMAWSIVFWAVVGIPFVGTFFVIENPKITKLKKIDMQITRGLDALQSQVRFFSQEKDLLPADTKELHELQGRPNIDGYTASLRKTHNITYQKLDDTKYKLCATFQRNNQNDPENKDRESFLTSEWRHEKGQHCFEFTKKEQVLYNGVRPSNKVPLRLPLRAR